MISPQKAVLMLVSTALLTTACNSTLNTSQLESTIKADVERQGRRLTLRQVTCPSDMGRQMNASFRCVGELDPEGTFTINVVQVDSQGTVRWEIPNSRAILNLVKVENQIQESLAKLVGKQTVIDCGTEAYRINQAGDRFECQVVGGVAAGTDQINAVLVKVSPDGNLTWQEMSQSAQAVAAAPNQPTVGAANQPNAGATPQAGTAASVQPSAKPTLQGTAKRPVFPGDSQ